MSKLIVEKNKITVDGHASDLETCSTLTNLCDELAKSDKFKTIAYGRGYGEFESVVDNEDRKFAQNPFYLFDKDKVEIGSITTGGEELIVTEKGLSLKNSGSVKWTYNRNGIFVGFKDYKGKIYKKGSVIPLAGEGDGYQLYLVEGVYRHFRSDESWANHLGFTGSYNSPTYITTSGCKLVVDKDTGYAFIILQSGNSTAYENIYFNPSTLPSGVTSLPVQTYGGPNSGAAQRYFVQVLTGIKGPIQVTVNLDQINSSYDYVRATLTVAYV